MATPSFVLVVNIQQVPYCDVIVTVSPSSTGLPFASRTTIRIALVLAPSAVRFAGDAVTAILEGGPAINSTVVLSEIPPTSATTVAVPRFTVLVRIAVATPLFVHVTLDMVPAEVVKVAAVPFDTVLPLLSVAVTRIVVLVRPSATIWLLPAVTDTVATDPPPPFCSSELPQERIRGAMAIISIMMSTCLQREVMFPPTFIVVVTSLFVHPVV